MVYARISLTLPVLIHKTKKENDTCVAPNGRIYAADEKSPDDSGSVEYVFQTVN